MLPQDRLAAPVEGAVALGAEGGCGGTALQRGPLCCGFIFVSVLPALLSWT